jgi:hypothetical protein
MNPVLAQKLIEKGVLAAEAEIEAEYATLAMGGFGTTTGRGIFLIQDIKPLDGSHRFDVISTRDGSQRQLTSENIIAIDGMDPIRYASVYNVKADGIDAKLGKRRGRRPKVRSPHNG